MVFVDHAQQIANHVPQELNVTSVQVMPSPQEKDALPTILNALLKALMVAKHALLATSLTRTMVFVENVTLHARNVAEVLVNAQHAISGTNQLMVTVSVECHSGLLLWDC